MQIEVVMPQMGESVAEGTLTQWLKEIGDTVERDEPLFEITTDKVDAEVPSPTAGVLVKWLVAPGATVAINTVVAIIEGQESGDTITTQAPKEASSSTTPAIVAPASTTPAAPTPRSTPAQSTGLISSVRPGVESDVDDLRKTRSTPLVRRIAAAHGIQNLNQIPASGKSGRVTKKDILGFIAHGSPLTQASHTASAPQPLRTTHAPVQLPSLAVGERDTIESMTPQRLSIAKHMIASRATSAHAHTVHEIDFSAVWRARQALKGDFEKRGVKLTFTAFMVKAFGQALLEFPIMNSSMDGDSIVYRGDVNIGVAVALKDSLIVPVVHHVDELSLLGVARAINDLASRARHKRLKPDEVKGGTFTVSNHGVFGPEFGIPVINQPQVGIVATGAIKKRVVVDQHTDAIMVRPTSIFCMSFDHRLVDGATADKFLMHVRHQLEHWEF